MAQPTPSPSHIVTVFRNRLRPGVDAEFEAEGERMDLLARAMPGFVEAKDFTAEDGERLTLVVFTDAASQRAWRDHPEHRAAQRRGAREFYAEYTLMVGETYYESRFSMSN